MKIGILTFPNSKSYGAALQMLALCSVCKKLGYDTEIINYHNLWMKQEKHIVSAKGKRANTWMKKKLSGFLHLPMIKGFARFENQMKKYPAKPIFEKKELPLIADRYGAVICGSDQVWNPNITNFDKSFFLDFCGPETSRISYAPSFGVEALPAAFAEEVKYELDQFAHVSVREYAGQKIIRELTGENAKLVVDPTLLLDGEEWMRHETAYPQACGDYILYYTVRSSQTLWDHCVKLAEKTNMKILRIGSNIISRQFKKRDGVEYVSDAAPDQWLYLLRNARYVVTNSFHGTAFAINFKKDFYVEFSSTANDRLSNLVKILKLEDRVLSDGKEIIPVQTDYSETDGILSGLKEESINFLEQALKTVSVKNRKRNA